MYGSLPRTGAGTVALGGMVFDQVTVAIVAALLMIALGFAATRFRRGQSVSG